MEFKKLFFLSLGGTLLGLGVVGIFLPILPTTPFILAAFLCFTKSSKKAEEWISRNRYFASYIENYKTNKGVPMDVKLKSIAFLWATLLISMVYFNQYYLFIILPLVGLGVTAHIASLKTYRQNKLNSVSI